MKKMITEIEVESRFDYYKLNLTQFNNIHTKNKKKHERRDITLFEPRSLLMSYRLQ